MKHIAILALSSTVLLATPHCTTKDDCDCITTPPPNYQCTYVNQSSSPLLLIWAHRGHEVFAPLEIGSTVTVDLFDGHGTKRHEELGVPPTEFLVEAGDTTIILATQRVDGGYNSSWLDRGHVNGQRSWAKNWEEYVFTDSVLVALWAEARAAGISK